MKQAKVSMQLVLSVAVLQAAVVASLSAAEVESAASGAWKRHAIDNTSRGADGVKLGDFNRDGLQDIVTCEERDQLGVVWYENPSR